MGVGVGTVSTIIDRSLIGVRLIGQPGLASDLVALVLGLEVELIDDEPTLPKEVPALILLVDPRQKDWDAALTTGAPVILVSGQALAPGEVTEAVVRGADAVVHADSDLEQLHEAVRVLLEGGTLLDPHQTRALALAARSRGDTQSVEISLTLREKQILQSIERGEVVKQTAIALGISAKTVENLQGRLFCKLAVRNRAQAVSRAHQLGLLARLDRGLGQNGQ
ncbi:MAG TPA: response regulator transcription factor [Acidimicrobiales bacterium]|nr:response regulator transcription factor [Acidimicrobiales bacterium]